MLTSFPFQWKELLCELLFQDTSSLSDLPESDKYWDREKQIGGDGLGQAGVADWDERKMDA
jgi:hypothetical protein